MIHSVFGLFVLFSLVDIIVMIRLKFVLILLALGGIVVAGCGRTGLKGLVSAEGVVLCDGVPLEGAVVSFFPSSEEGRSAVGRSDVNGKFILTTLITNDGAFPDTYKVAVTKNSKPTLEVPEAKEGETLKEKTARMRTATRSKDSIKSLLPDKYSSPALSGLTVTIPKKGDKNIKLEISMTK